ncbi:MAG: ABC transporter ATP-binding protein [Ilumatobacter sp.]|nr:ABC transporter ATP-binding protein [Ilumatobacter sp.]
MTNASTETTPEPEAIGAIATDDDRPGDPRPAADTAAPSDLATDPPAAANDSNSIRATDLRMSFDGVEVIHGVSVTVEPGTIVGLIGPSGCGKTTTVRMMTGLLEPSAGSASIGSTPSTELSKAQRARIGYLPQTPALFPDLSLIENLSFHSSMYGLPFRRKDRLRQVLEWVELWDDRRKLVSQASGGMQRRLALAAAFVHDPDVIFLDEPTAGLDPILREKLWNQFRDIAETGKSMVVTTQYVGEAGKCDAVGLLSDGEMLLLDSPANLRRAAFGGEVVDVVTERPLANDELARLSDWDFVVGEVALTAPNAVRIVVDDADRALLDLQEAFEALGVELVEASEYEVDYDEAFVRVVERHRDGARGAEPSADDAADALVDDREGSPHGS